MTDDLKNIAIGAGIFAAALLFKNDFSTKKIKKEVKEETGLGDKPTGRKGAAKFAEPKASKKKVEFLADTENKTDQLAFLKAGGLSDASEFPGMVYDAGDVAGGGRLEKYWSENKVNLEKFTKAKAFDKSVQTNSEAFRKYFGFRAVEFGNWTTQEDRVQYLFGAAHALKEFASIADVPCSMIGLNNTLTIAFGARGRGGSAAAHYEPSKKAINITKPHSESGSLAHEYAHALDNCIAEKLNFGDYVTSADNAPYTTTIRLIPSKIEEGGFPGLAEKIFEVLYWDGTEQTKFAKNISQSRDYWARRIEVFARSTEVWVSQRAKAKNLTNTMLIKLKYDEPRTYPSLDQVDKAYSFFKEFFSKGIRLVNGESVSINKTTEVKTETEEPKRAASKPKAKKVEPKPEPKPKAQPKPKPEPKPKEEPKAEPKCETKEEKSRREMAELKELMKQAMAEK